MKIIEKKRFDESIFWSKSSDVNKFFSSIEKASDVLDNSYVTGLEPDDYIVEYARLFGSYMRVIYNTLEDYDNDININENELLKEFRFGFKNYK